MTSVFPIAPARAQTCEYWVAPAPNAASLVLTYTKGTLSNLVTGMVTTTQADTLTGLTPYSLYAITLTARGAGNAILAQSNTLRVLTTDLHVSLPWVTKNIQ